MPISVQDFPGLLGAGDRVQDIVDIRWTHGGSVCFRARCHETPLPSSLAVSFRRFCDVLVFNYPGILRAPAQPEDLVHRPPTLDLWRLRDARCGYSLEPIEQVTIDLGLVSSTASATTAARRALGDHTSRFERHPWLDAPFALWDEVPLPTSKAAHALLRSSATARCEAEQAARQHRWFETDPQIAGALAGVEWTELMAVAGAPAAHRLLFHKLKRDRLSGWDRVHACRGCPHCPVLGSAGGTAYHSLWACPKAQARWQQLLDYWAPLHSTPRAVLSAATKHDVFGLQLHTMPDRIWQLPSITRLGVPSPHDTVATRLALTAVWRRHVLITCYTIWRWRTSPDSEAEIWTEAQARARHGVGLHAVSHDVRWGRTDHSAATKFTSAALDALFGATTLAEPTALEVSRPDDGYLLFFDGGSRGNPGPGGSGAVIVRFDSSTTRAQVVWSAAMARGSTSTTNNQAEYHGLLTSLTAAHSQRWQPLTVVGDSQLILRQMAAYHPPKNVQLLAYYAPARRLADALQVRAWTHHRRAYNTMADAAANVAMDTATSSQVFHPTTRPEHNHIASMLAGDFAHWQVGHLASQV